MADTNELDPVKYEMFLQRLWAIGEEGRKTGVVDEIAEIMGATNPANADEGTIRKDFAESIEANSVHGSDAQETAVHEISYFFSELDLVG